MNETFYRNELKWKTKPWAPTKNCSLADTEFLEPCDVTKYGSGWKKDVVNQCLEFDDTRAARRNDGLDRSRCLLAWNEVLDQQLIWNRARPRELVQNQHTRELTGGYRNSDLACVWIQGAWVNSTSGTSLAFSKQNKQQTLQGLSYYFLNPHVRLCFGQGVR